MGAKWVINFHATVICKESFIKNLQEYIIDFRVSLFYLIKKKNTMLFVLNLFSQLATLLVSNITWI